MRIRQIAISVAFATGLAALPLSTAKAQYYAPCSPFPLAWPFCVAGAVVGTAATIVAAPFWLLAGAPPYGYYAPPYYAAQGYSAQGVPPYSAYARPPAAAPQTTPGLLEPLTPPRPTAPPPAGHALPPVQNAYYFCPTSKGYYPYVASCAVAWQAVPTTPLQPPLEGLAHAQQVGPRVIAQFRNSSGQHCQKLEQSIFVDGIQQRATAVECESADGQWVISPQTIREATD